MFFPVIFTHSKIMVGPEVEAKEQRKKMRNKEERKKLRKFLEKEITDQELRKSFLHHVNTVQEAKNLIRILHEQEWRKKTCFKGLYFLLRILQIISAGHFMIMDIPLYPITIRTFGMDWIMKQSHYVTHLIQKPNILLHWHSPTLPYIWSQLYDITWGAKMPENTLNINLSGQKCLLING